MNRIHFRSCYYLVTLIGAALLCQSASASIIEPFPDLPPTVGGYNIPDLCITPVCLENIFITNFVVITNQIIGSDQHAHTTGELDAEVFQNIGGSPGAFLGLIQLTGPIDFVYFGRNTLTKLGTFNAEITDLDLTGMLNGHTVEAILNPAMPSVGVTTIESLAGTREYRVTSFFDVFAELSIDGGPFVPGPVRHGELEVPEPATGAFALAGLLALAALRRRAS